MEDVGMVPVTKLFLAKRRRLSSLGVVTSCYIVGGRGGLGKLILSWMEGGARIGEAFRFCSLRRVPLQGSASSLVQIIKLILNHEVAADGSGLNNSGRHYSYTNIEYLHVSSPRKFTARLDSRYVSLSVKSVAS